MYLIVIAAVFAGVNNRFIKLPGVIGVMTLSLMASLAIIVIGEFVPLLTNSVAKFVRGLNFSLVFLNIMLGFLLFAGAMHVDARKLKRVMWPVVALSTIGVFISAFLVSVMAWYLFRLLHVDMPYIYCLLFGALISPTDPIAVMAILRRAGISAGLELKITGESLFNDGVGVVMFFTIMSMITHGGHFSAGPAILLFIREAGGGILFGLILGYLAHFLTGKTNNYGVEVLITLALVMFGYAKAGDMHISGPLAVIVAGIIFGTKRTYSTTGGHQADHLIQFWDLIDELFNAILFLLLGFELMIIRPNIIVMICGIVMIAIVLFARWLSVLVPVYALKKRVTFAKNSVAILTWGGLRGGLSVAMALSVPVATYRDSIVLVTYVIVVFSIVVQGLTIGRVAGKLIK